MTTLTVSIVKDMFQFAYIDSYPISSSFEIVYLRQNLALLITKLHKFGHFGPGNKLI